MEGEEERKLTETENLHVIIKTPFEGYPLKGSFLNTQPKNKKKHFSLKS